MTSKSGGIYTGFIPGVAAFVFPLVMMPYDSAPALWWGMAGLCGLTMLLTILEAGSGELPGLFSLAIASVIVLSVMTEFAADAAGINPADHPLTFGLFLAVIIGFPLGVLAWSSPDALSPLPAFLAGMSGVIYMPLPLWLSVKLGLTGYMIDVFDPRLQFGQLLGWKPSIFTVLADLSGMVIASGITLLILAVPGFLVAMIVRTLLGR